MRQVLIFILLLFTAVSNAETRDSLDASYSVASSVNTEYIQHTNYEDLSGNYKQTRFWHKHNTYKAWAWSTLGVGLACGAAAVIIVFVPDHDDYGILGPFGYLSYGGGLACIASIPLFIQSHRYKVKAKKSVSLSLNATAIPVSSPMGKYKQMPALGFAISL